MTELKQNNKRSVDIAGKQSAVKKLKPAAAPDKMVKNIKEGKLKFEKKKLGIFSDKPGANRKFQQQQQQTEKTDWNELKQKKKDLKIQRKKNKTKDLYDIDIKAKKIYEELKM